MDGAAGVPLVHATITSALVPATAGYVAARLGIVESNRYKAAEHMDGDHANDRITPPKRLDPRSPGAEQESVSAACELRDLNVVGRG